MAPTAHDRRTHTYAARLVWTGSHEVGTIDYASYGRAYSVFVPGKPELLGSADPAFRGDPTRHDPEDLFLAAVAGCHMLSYLALCARQGVQVLAYEDAARGVLALDAHGGGRFTDIELTPTVTIAERGDEARALRLHRLAHERCFIASSSSVPIRCHATVRTAVAPATGRRAG